MENYWTSNESINGLRHFVLVNKINEQDQINFLMVSVVDVEISLRISDEELLNSGNWNEGWLNLPKSCLLYTSPSPRDRQKSRMPSSA